MRKNLFCHYTDIIVKEKRMQSIMLEATVQIHMPKYFIV